MHLPTSKLVFRRNAEIWSGIWHACWKSCLYQVPMLPKIDKLPQTNNEGNRQLNASRTPLWGLPSTNTHCLQASYCLCRTYRYGSECTWSFTKAAACPKACALDKIVRLVQPSMMTGDLIVQIGLKLRHPAGPTLLCKQERYRISAASQPCCCICTLSLCMQLTLHQNTVDYHSHCCISIRTSLLGTADAYKIQLSWCVLHKLESRHM